MFRSLIAAAALAFAAQAAKAATYQFTYDFASGVTLSATIEGDLQVDGNTVVVTSVTEAALSGATSFAFPAFASIDSTRDILLAENSRSPVLLLDPALGALDLGACATSSCTTASIGLAIDTTGGVAPFPVVGYGTGSGPVFEAFDAGRYSLVEIAAVPIPATLPLLGGAVLLIGATRRRTA